MTWLNKIALLLVCVLLTACTSTIVPNPINATVASWDGGQQNSGFLGFDAAGNGIITYHAYGRWIALVNDYGPFFKPPQDEHAGVNVVLVSEYPVQLYGNGKVIGVLTNPVPSGPGDWPYMRMDAERLAKFDRMNRWRKEGKAPFK